MPQKNVTCAEAAVEELLAKLDEIYQNYIEKTDSHEKSFRGMGRLFKRWFSSYNPSVAEPIHQEFLDGVAGVTGQLLLVFEQVSEENPEICRAYAARAADLIMAPKKPDREKSAADWYLAISEYQFAPLLPFLNSEDLRRLRDAQLKTTPKRMMVPKQREMLQTMEDLLDKHSNE